MPYRASHAACLIVVAAGGCAAPPAVSRAADPAATDEPPTNQTVADEMSSALWAGVEHFYGDQGVDREHGGFIAGFDEHWNPADRQTKGLVYQARMTWTAAEIARRRPERAPRFEALAAHGLAFLEEAMWDPQYGGFFWELDAQGQFDPALTRQKHTYGQAFAVYAAANASRVLNDGQRALDLAIRGYRWIEEHARDPRHGGYFEALTREGTPILEPPADDPMAKDAIGTAYGYKSMNTHIHLLEAYTTLYQAWPDPGLRRRLEQLFVRVRDDIQVAPGCLNLFFTRDWQPVPDHDSFGHDVETAFLLVEAAQTLGEPDAHDIWPIARRLVDHALLWGYDHRFGGTYDAGAAFAAAHNQSKIWWTQAETLNALLLMHDRFGDQTDRYRDAFHQTWRFVDRYMIDHQAGGWRPAVDRDGDPLDNTDKASNWKACYHTTRALLNCIDRLRGVATGPADH